jgi:hypothetical protein
MRLEKDTAEVAAALEWNRKRDTARQDLSLWFGEKTNIIINMKKNLKKPPVFPKRLSGRIGGKNRSIITYSDVGVMG